MVPSSKGTRSRDTDSRGTGRTDSSSNSKVTDTADIRAADTVVAAVGTDKHHRKGVAA